MIGRFQRNTRQRQVILEELRNTQSHPTVAEIYDLVQRRLPHISLGTVYRNLDLLVEHGLVRKLDSGGSQARFDADLRSHYHIRCLRCGRLDDMNVTPQSFMGEVSKPTDGYQMLGHRLEFFGVCGNCQKQSLPSHVNNKATGRNHRPRQARRKRVPDRDSTRA
jgi:Fur family ferric uptake transcriptional regulator